MLVLSRKLSQQVLIGSDIRVTVVKIDGNHVRLGIEAPRDVSILREELARRQIACEATADNRVGRQGIPAL